MVTGAIEHGGWSERLFAWVQPLLTGGDVPWTAVAVVLSNLVSNVPTVMLFLPIVPHLPDPQHVWLLLAMATTLASNLTLLGSVANLVVAELAHSCQVNLSFIKYLKAGSLITLLTLIWGVIWRG